MTHLTKPNVWVSLDTDANTTLSYSLKVSPSPLTASIPLADPVFALLEFVITNPTTNTINVSSITIGLPVGSASNCITPSTAGILTSVNNVNWILSAPPSVSAGLATFTLGPVSGSTVALGAGESIVVLLYDIQTNTLAGNSILTINETTDTGSGTTSFQVTTFQSGFYFNGLTATSQSGSSFVPVAQVNNGSTITLLWNSSVVNPGAFTILYSDISNGQQTAIPQDAGIWTSPTLNSNTVFTVQVTVQLTGGQPITASQTILVAVLNPNLVVANINAGTGTVTGAFNVNGQLTANTAVTTGGITAGGTITANGDVNFNKFVRIEGPSVNSPNAQDERTFSMGGNGNFQIDAPNVIGGRFLVTNSGVVGIGNNNPDTTKRLDVAGNTLLRGDLQVTGNVYLNANNQRYPAGIKYLLNTLSASNSSDLNDTTSFTTAFNFYEIIFNNVQPVNNDTHLLAQFYVSGNWASDNNYSSENFSNDSTGNTIEEENNGFFCLYSQKRTGPQALTGVYGEMTVYNPSHSGAYTCYIASIVASTAKNSKPCLTMGGGAYRGSSNPVTGIRFYFGSGNINSGTISIYGWN